MELIDKGKVIKEVEKLYEENYKYLPSDIVENVEAFKDDLLVVLNMLSTVKEVDLEKEFDKYTKDISAQDIKYEPFTQLFECAKHFFELGLKTQKGE